MEYGYSPKQKEFFDEKAGVWDEITVHDMSKVDRISDALGIEDGWRILDVGTGTGVMLPFYEARMGSGRVTAVDYSEKMIDVARRKYPEERHPRIEYVVSDIYDLDYREEFDLAVCYSCFPHFTDKTGAVRKLAGMVREGGRVAVAHSSSADHINSVHRRSGGSVALDILPPMDRLVEMMEREGLRAVFTRDDDEYYICICRKS